MYRNTLQDFARASMALPRLQVCSNCVSCQEMHVSATWIIKEYFDSAGCWEGWRGFIQMSGMLKSISIIT